jgi:hemerythrin
MPQVKLNPAHSVFVPILDAEHRGLLDAVDELRQAAARGDKPASLSAMRALAAQAADHFAHEERMMIHTRYHLLEWHKRQHDTNRKRLREFAARFEKGDAAALEEAAAYMTAWMADHTGVHDRMLSAHLRAYAWEPYHSSAQASGGARISSSSGFLANRLSAAKTSFDRNPARRRLR